MKSLFRRFAWLYPLLPLISLFMPNRDNFLVYYELLTETAVVLFLAVKFKKGLSSGNRPEAKIASIFLAFCALLIADTIYNWRVVNNITAYDFLKCFGEANYSAFMLFLLTASFLSLGKLLKRPLFLSAVMLVFILVGGLNLYFIVIPFEFRVPRFPLFSLIANPLYSLLSSLLAALTIPYVLRLNRYRSFAFFQAILLLAASDFAIRYQSAFTGTNLLGWAEPGWAAAIGAMATLIFFSKDTRDIFEEQGRAAEWLSVRVLFSLAVGLANILLLCCVLLINAYTMRNAVDLSSILLILFGFWLISNLIAMKISKDLNTTAAAMFNIKEAGQSTTAMPVPSINRQLLLHEINSFIDSYNALAGRTNSLIKTLIETEKDAAIGKVATQVAHDIRSPLAALGAAAKGLELPNEQRLLLGGAIDRMQGIADDLLRRYRTSGTEVKATTDTCALAGLIEQVIAEKRLQLGENTGIKIDFNGADGIKATVDKREFQRIISNLLNNAIEAFEKDGTIAVSLSSTDGLILLEIEDNGKGIPPEVLAKLGLKGETHGKSGGTGLGLYHARTSVESWGGSLKVVSTVGEGTIITITIPAATKPAAGLRAVLLDDDPLVHMNWKMAAKSAGAELKSYKTPQELAGAAETLPRDIPLYIDSELGDDIKGEDIAKTLHDKGFTDISMATGHSAEKFASLPWLKVVGKEPPWN